DTFGYRWIEATWTNQLSEPAVRGYVVTLRDATLRKRSIVFSLAVAQVMEHILSGAPVPEALELLARALEAFIPAGVAAISIVVSERRRRVPVATPSLPDEVVAQIDRLSPVHVERFLGTFPTSVIENIAAECPQPDLSSTCAEHGLHALWALPIGSPDG